ncbi:uncharacterized protein BKA55DRAFT_583362 [Fusarium redolens]|uniref:Uncharacterized protein n=1 Tax=Fusarium redolens TaxID=48865 RepID=A0A9P9JS35_FUSRE|nr:uncharacterized protein BKA55DRAFT_583362 [Fusarium redolens]KAH7230070.1 hypothetical protein BKA55DRAFT_583362 [Fusarium redolens]
MGNRWHVLTAIGGYIAVAVIDLLSSEEASSELIDYCRAVEGPKCWNREWKQQSTFTLVELPNASATRRASFQWYGGALMMEERSPHGRIQQIAVHR